MERAHVLILPFPSQGHVNPMLQFAKRLASHGLMATVAFTPSPSTPHLADFPTISFIEISDGRDAIVSSTSSTGRDVKGYFERFRVAGSATLGEAIDRFAAEGKPVNCVAYDPFLPWAVDVARGRGVAAAAFFTQSCTVSALYKEARGNYPAGTLSSPLAVDGLPPVGRADLPSFLVDPVLYETYLNLLFGQFSNLEGVDIVLFNTFHKLESEIVKSIEKLWPTKTIGPTIPSMYLDKRMKGDIRYGFDLTTQDDEQCMGWLDLKSAGSTVYVSFGTMANLGSEKMEELGWGLRNSGKNFLWVVRSSEVDDLPDEFRNIVGSDTELVTNWCPQLDVLAHPAIGCFVTHCGWNSTLEALSLGVPMVAVPQSSDQPTNAWLVEKEWGIGVRARADRKGVVRREEIEWCIKEIMDGEKGEEVRKNGGKYKEMAVEAVGEGGSSDKCIKEFIALIKNT